MNYLIAGGTGLVGRALLKNLSGPDNQLTLISRDPGARPGLPEGVTLIGWERAGLVAALENAQVVINLAGASISGQIPLGMRWTQKRKAEILTSRLQAGKLLTDALALAAQKPEVLVQASAIGYYGSTGPGSVAETAGPGSDFLARVCLDWEASTQKVEELGLRRIVARIGLVLSPRGGLLDLLKLPFYFYLGGPIGSGQQVFSWIHIEDLAQAICFLVEDPQARGPFNLTSPEPVQNQEFARQLGSALGRPSWLRLPAWGLKILLGESSTLALEGRSIFPQKLMEAGYNFHYAGLESALQDLTARSRPGS